MECSKDEVLCGISSNTQQVVVAEVLISIWK